MRRAAWCVAALVVGVCGCDPILSVRGMTREAPEPCGARVSGAVYDTEPVPHATIRMACPWESDSEPLTFESDAEGRVDFVTAGLWPRECDVVVEKEGYRTERYSAHELCATGDRDDWGCHGLVVYAELVPREAQDD